MKSQERSGFGIWIEILIEFLENDSMYTIVINHILYTWRKGKCEIMNLSYYFSLLCSLGRTLSIFESCFIEWITKKFLEGPLI